MRSGDLVCLKNVSTWVWLITPTAGTWLAGQKDIASMIFLGFNEQTSECRVLMITANSHYHIAYVFRTDLETR